MEDNRVSEKGGGDMRESQEERVCVQTEAGVVCGKSSHTFSDDGCDLRRYFFLGIPYGRAERFRPPEPVRWQGEWLCTQYGPLAPQPNFRGKKPEGLDFQMMGSEDCLNLNIWSTCLDRNARLPVVVAVHGGAFQTGGNSLPQFSGESFMDKEEMVFVSVNYRVGVLGFLELGQEYGGRYEGSGNCGMWDLLLALKWIERNIAAFGGDPDRIILMGISAGAKAIASLMTLPKVQAMCHRVILESGAMQSFRTRETAEEVSARYRSLLPEETDLRMAPAELLVEKQAEFCACEGSTCFFGPVLAAPFAPDWTERWKQGECFRGKAIIGCGRHEMIRTVQQPGFMEAAETIAGDLFGRNGKLASQIVKMLVQEGVAAAEAWETVFSDFMYRYYSFDLAKRLEADGNDVWCYSFEYGSACHGMGYAYLMKDLDYPEPIKDPLVRSRATRISEEMRRRIYTFIREDDLEEKEWPRYRGRNQLVFDEKIHVEYQHEDLRAKYPERVYTFGSGSEG